MDNRNKVLEKIIKDYDALLPFNRYLSTMFGEYDFPDGVSFKICCPLHEEKTPSFSYSHNLDLWTCFGQCHTSGKTVRFHYLWLNKTQGKTNLVYALRDLQRRYPYILPPVEDYLDKNYTSNKENKQSKLAWALESALPEKSKQMQILNKEDISIDEEILNIFMGSRGNK